VRINNGDICQEKEAKAKFKAYANMYASAVCSKIVLQEKNLAEGKS
jgi:hypothetical protein